MSVRIAGSDGHAGELLPNPRARASRSRSGSGGWRSGRYLSFPFLASFLSFFSFAVSFGLFVFAVRFLF